jgi:hypothetical protein
MFRDCLQLILANSEVPDFIANSVLVVDTQSQTSRSKQMEAHRE